LKKPVVRATFKPKTISFEALGSPLFLQAEIGSGRFFQQKPPLDGIARLLWNAHNRIASEIGTRGTRCRKIAMKQNEADEKGRASLSAFTLSVLNSS
jgi:hypothetical protein